MMWAPVIGVLRRIVTLHWRILGKFYCKWVMGRYTTTHVQTIMGHYFDAPGGPGWERQSARFGISPLRVHVAVMALSERV